MSINVLFVTSEAYPLIKTGGLGDVSYALPNALRQQGVDIRVLLPGYKSVLEQLSLIEVSEEFWVSPLSHPIRLLAGIMADGKTPVYVIECPNLYEREEGGPYQDKKGIDWSDNALRFAILSKVAALFGQHHFLFKPHIIHCNDWQSGLTPAFLKYAPHSKVRTVMSIHNIAYQGIFGAEVVQQLGLPPESFNMYGLEYHGDVSFLKAGLYYADWITTVSPTYAKEIQTSKYSHGLDGLLTQRHQELTGIINGIDTTVWNPETDPHLNTNYNASDFSFKKRNTKDLRQKCHLSTSKQTPLIGLISRLTEQKGIDLLLPIIPDIIKSGAQLVMLGSGQKTFEKRLQALADLYPKQFSLTLGYDEALAHQIEAGAHIFLMPSQFEPCGLNQMYSMHYGTIPVVRRTGGLSDTVIDARFDNATGFVFKKEHSKDLLSCIQRAIHAFRDKETWKQLQSNGMNRDFSWDKSAHQYKLLYQNLIA